MPGIIYEINTLTDYLNAITNIKKNNKSVFETLFYRGQSSINYKLKPSVARESAWVANEGNMMKRAIANFPSQFSGLNLFDVLAKLQHYEIPTRLLDFTENPLIALYFACGGNKVSNSKDGEVVFLNSNNKNFYTSENIIANLIASIALVTGKSTEPIPFSAFLETLFLEATNFAIQIYSFKNSLERAGSEKSFASSIKDKMLNPILVIPQFWNERVIRQSGAFLLFPNEISAESTHGEGDSGEFLILHHMMDYKQKIYQEMGCRIIIPTGAKGRIIDELDTFGINHKYLFPELKEYSSYLKEKLEKEEN